MIEFLEWAISSKEHLAIVFLLWAGLVILTLCFRPVVVSTINTALPLNLEEKKNGK